jgi:hypothetical protein
VNLTDHTGHTGLVPSEFYLSQNYPNPFCDKTTIKFCMAYTSRVTLDIVHWESGMIERLIDEEKSAGTFEVELVPTGLPEGSYVCIFRAGDCVATKMMLLKR